VTYSDLNAEFDNVLNNFEPLMLNDYSTNVTQMQVVTDPGEVGTESLATTLAGELARLRNMLKEITGKTHWYESPANSLASLSTAVGGGIADNRIVSCRKRTASSQSIALVPHGTNRTASLKGATTNFVYYINGVQYTISTDVVSATLLAAPASNNTCLVDDAGASGTEDTKYIGEFGTELTVDTMGTEISALVGKLAAFKVGAEYFIARVKSATKLTEVRRGYCFDSTDTPLPRVAISNNDSISLMKLAWIYAKTNGTIVAGYTEPRVQDDEPASPATGDYWFDIGADIWKLFDGASWNSADATFVGIAISNTTATVAARSADIFVAADGKSNVQIEKFDNASVRSKQPSSEINVFGSELKFQEDLARWDMTLNLDSGVTEAADTLYYFYLTETGDSVISDLCPSYRAEYAGMYHPFHTWRCVGQAYNDASSNIEAVVSYHDASEQNYALTHKVAANALTLKVHAPPFVSFKIKNTTAAAPDWEVGAILPGTQFVVSSGSTLGTTSATTEDLFAHLIFTSKRAELAVCGTFCRQGDLVTTVAEGGAGGADSLTTLYSNLVRTAVPLLPLAKVQNNQTTAGTWAALFSKITLWPFALDLPFSQSFTASGTWVVPQGRTRCWVEGVGGGGGGGAGEGGGIWGGGGGGCIKQIRHFVGLTAGTSITVTIGAAGGAAAAGGSTIFNSVTVCNGAPGGVSSAGSHGAGAALTSYSTNGGTNSAGGNSESYSGGTTTGGGASSYGAGGSGASPASTSYGAGAGGNTGVGSSGLPAAAGFLVVYWE
jgi:hypothetical protein